MDGWMGPVAIYIGDSFISIIILNKRSFFFVLLIVIVSVGKMEMGSIIETHSKVSKMALVIRVISNKWKWDLVCNPFGVNENESHHLIHSTQPQNIS
jgi:hypothetical protein